MANNNGNSGNDPLSDAELKDQPAPQRQSKTKGQCIICGQNTMRKCNMYSIPFICTSTCHKRQLVAAYKSVVLYHNISTRELDIRMKENVLFERMGTLFYVYPGILLTHKLKWFCNCAISEKDDLSGRVRRLLLHSIADKEGERI
ncbi:hypothetical protein CGMCC3_g14451 [Colletotrichum fructicola]|uniref:Uncharacterized protein n=1 Tax=Colletotrichum fructicola (strain Nara gc5) TaxID=1213859 RepID=A0A7J6J7T1_COLFN|nr:uncharacterized protein CGMCC3_g14451 [Colletotrichum fructicola]KAE9569452.1 hypothetical protein CGMCC3_g14451 [Colletotrichum fructicola]KAF4484628.1 hypothetical protein CGGC5_v007064 [Colletotrichum fructicola Nara gc5]KAI8281211.1 hypothetical protein K4K60_004362 [Colletotrichum sp. SAR11_57]